MPATIALTERKSEAQKMIEQLTSVPLTRLYQASFRAVVRMHLFFTGRTHELLLEYARKAQALILKAGGRDGVLDGTTGLTLQRELLELWQSIFEEWAADFEKIRTEAASIPFGVIAVAHERMVIPAQKTIEERVEDGVFSPQLSTLLHVASDYLYGDSLNLSQRIWRIDRDAQTGINALIMNAIANGTSAWDLAQELEQYLGANADCPRWTSTRLYGRTKKDLAGGDTTGLLRGKNCDGSGVAYNALRLARTEIQKIHALATDRILASQPWVEKEKINLSAAHPKPDICDDIASGGENGEGIYPVGSIELPLHPNCLCYKTAVLMSEKEFTSRLRGWMTGQESWSQMDEYEDLIGGDIKKSILPNAIHLAIWLFGDNLEKWLK